MILAWIVWFFLVPQLFWLDRVLAGTLVRPLDLGLAVCFVLALFARTRALPALLLAAAVGRSLIDDGSVALHFLALGVPVAVLLPARGVFRGIVWQASAAALSHTVKTNCICGAPGAANSSQFLERAKSVG